MPYRLVRATSSEEIAERQWAVGPNLTFTTFTSCIGVIAVCGQKNLIGIHLVLTYMDGDGEHQFAVEDVAHIVGILRENGYDRDTVVIAGCLGYWANSGADSIRKAYDSLVASLPCRKTHRYLGAGIWGASFSNRHRIRLTHKATPQAGPDETDEIDVDFPTRAPASTTASSRQRALSWPASYAKSYPSVKHWEL